MDEYKPLKDKIAILSGDIVAELQTLFKSKDYTEKLVEFRALRDCLECVKLAAAAVKSIGGEAEQQQPTVIFFDPAEKDPEKQREQAEFMESCCN